MWLLQPMLNIALNKEDNVVQKVTDCWDNYVMRVSSGDAATTSLPSGNGPTPFSVLPSISF